MAENEVMEMAGAGVSDVQDDFKSSKYKGVLRYSEDNIIKDLFGKRESVSKTEGEMLIQGYLKKINEDIIFLKPKKDIRHNGLLKNVYKIHSAKREFIIMHLIISIIIHIFAVIYHQIKKRLKFIHLWRKELCQGIFLAKSVCLDMKNKEGIWKIH